MEKSPKSARGRLRYGAVPVQRGDWGERIEVGEAMAAGAVNGQAIKKRVL